MKDEKIESAEAGHVQADDYFKIISIIAHNVKGPIKYMQYITDFTLSNWDNMNPEDFKNCAFIINESSRNIDLLLNNLLNWARMQDRQLKCNNKTFDLGQIVEDELKIYLPFLKFKGVRLSKNIGSNLFVENDENLFRLILENLLSNALKFSPSNKEIGVKVYYSDLSHEMVLEVSDQGKGFTPEEIELFCQNSPRRHPGTAEELGSGYGLNISRNIAQLMGGDIRIESRPNSPTVVSLRLPR